MDINNDDKTSQSLSYTSHNEHVKPSIVRPQFQRASNGTLTNTNTDISGYQSTGVPQVKLSKFQLAYQ